MGELVSDYLRVTDELFDSLGRWEEFGGAIAKEALSPAEKIAIDSLARAVKERFHGLLDITETDSPSPQDPEMRAETVFGNGGGISTGGVAEKFARNFFVSKRTARQTKWPAPPHNRARSIPKWPTKSSPRS